jgi:pimeloyl-ACP methyl ester carboxylesterase
MTEEDIRRYARQSVAHVRLAPRRNTVLLAAGAALAAAALIVRQRTREVEQDNPPAGKFVEVEGIRLHYVECGSGQPVVLLHGDGSMIQDFELSGVTGLAAQKYRVIAFDRPGYGYSDRPRTTIWTPYAQARLLHRALQQIGVEQPIVVGHSWGTLVAIALGLDFPDDVKSLVLLSGYYYPTPRLDVPLLSSSAVPVIGDLMRYTVSPLIGRLIWPMMKKRIFAPAEVPHKFDARFPVWMTLRPSQLRASAADNALLIPAAYSMRRRYHELTMPVVIMSGDSDRHADQRIHSEQLHRELPHSSYHVTRGAGHMVHHLAPQEVVSAIDEAATALAAEQRTEYKHIFPAPAQPG